MDEILFLMKEANFSWDECYNMPIQLRKYSIRKVLKDREELAEIHKKQNTKGTSISMKDLADPNNPIAKPDYTTRASTK